jgi:DNA-binding NarL/FixJ family response regulator
MANRVLLVDDDLLVLEALQRVLHMRRPDFEVATARSGDEALAAMERAAADAVVLDYRMAGMNGIALAQAIRTRYPACCCLMLTGFADLEAAMAALNEASIFRFFQKPCPTDRLIDGIDAALAERERRQAAATLERLPFGALMLDRDGRVLRRNLTATRLLQAAGGPAIDAGGHLRGATQADTAALREAIARTGAGVSPVTIALQRGEGRPLVASVSATDDASGPIALFLTDPDTPPCLSAPTISQLYGLTPAEARLAAALTRGATMEAAATELGVTIASARTYLKTVFSKLGISRQTELVRLMLGAAPIAPSG